MFEGVFTALVTPFSKGIVDEEALRKLIELQIEAGVHGLVPCGSTGESATLSHDEHRKVVELTVEAAAGRENLIPIMLEAVRHYATVGEICGALVPVFGTYREVSVL